MPNKKKPETKCFRTLITIEVLSIDEPYVLNSLSDLAYDVDEGSFSGDVKEEISEEVDRKTFENLCWDQRSDPSFFFGDEGDEGEDESEEGAQ